VLELENDALYVDMEIALPNVGPQSAAVPGLWIWTSQVCGHSFEPS